MVVHSTNRWAGQHIDEDKEAVLAHMLATASRQCGTDLSVADVTTLHRWRYANFPKHSGPEFFVDSEAGLAACGDWFIRGRVEAAFTSADGLADELTKKC